MTSIIEVLNTLFAISKQVTALEAWQTYILNLSLNNMPLSEPHPFSKPGCGFTLVLLGANEIMCLGSTEHPLNASPFLLFLS